MDLFTGSPVEIVAISSTIGLIAKFVLERRKGDSQNLKFLVKQYQDELTKERESREKTDKKVSLLQRRIDMLESARFQSSVPMWIKDRKSRLIYGNKAYINSFLIPNGITYDFALDKTDLEIWPSAELAKMYMQNDREVMRTGVGGRFEGLMTENGVAVKYRACIDPYHINGEAMGVIGLAVPLE